MGCTSLMPLRCAGASPHPASVAEESVGPCESEGGGSDASTATTFRIGARLRPIAIASSKRVFKVQRYEAFERAFIQRVSSPRRFSVCAFNVKLSEKPAMRRSPPSNGQNTAGSLASSRNLPNHDRGWVASAEAAPVCVSNSAERREKSAHTLGSRNISMPRATEDSSLPRTVTSGESRDAPVCASSRSDTPWPRRSA